MKIKVLLAIFLCLVFASSVASKQNDQLTEGNDFSLLSKNEIEVLLATTEGLRTTDIKKFTGNLLRLENNQENFSKYQLCYYKYLEIYKISYLGQFSDAKNKLNSLFNSCGDINIQVRIKSLLANLLALSGEYQQSIDDLDFVISHLDEVNEKMVKHIGYSAGFIIYDTVNQSQLSLKFAELLINDEPSGKNLCRAKVYKYIALLKGENLIDIDKQIFSTIDMCQEVGDEVYAQILNVTWIKSKLFKVIGLIDVVAILDSLESSNGRIEKTKYKFIIAYKNSLFAQIHEKLNHSQQAVKYANLAIQDSITIGITEQKIDALQVLINHYQDIKDFEKANEYLIEKNLSENKLYSDKQAKLMAYQTVQHVSLAKTHQIKSLNQRNELLQLKNKLAEKSKKNQLLINLLFAIIVAFFIIFAYRMIRQQRKFKRMSELDHMTLIYNRKGIKDYMVDLLLHSKKDNKMVSYVIFDLDLFKRVNDVYGHIVGDWVIKQSIKVCKDLNNEKATFARIGGEEFSIVFRDSTIDESVVFSEEFRRAINAINTLDGCNHCFEVSASFGLTTSEISGYDYTKLMTHADNALYYSKENGRNRLTIYHPYTAKQ